MAYSLAMKGASHKLVYLFHQIKPCLLLKTRRISKTRNRTRPKRSRLMPPPGLHSRSNFNVVWRWLLTPKVDRFILLPHRPLVPVCSNLCSFVFKILCSQVCDEQTDGQTEIIPYVSLNWTRYKDIWKHYHLLRRSNSAGVFICLQAM